MSNKNAFTSLYFWGACLKTCVIPPALHCVLANVCWAQCCCCCAHCCSCLPFLTCSVRMKLGRRHPQLHMSECNNPFLLHCCCAPCALYQEALWMKKAYGDYNCCYYTCCMKTFCFPKAWPKSLWWISLESKTFRKTFKEEVRISTFFLLTTALRFLFAFFFLFSNFT